MCPSRIHGNPAFPLEIRWFTGPLNRPGCRGGDVSHVCYWSDIAGLWRGGKKRYPAQVAVNVKGRGGGCQRDVHSDKWVFTCLQPPLPSCNKSWHLFVTYDCISDCLGHDSIPEPPLSCRWRDSEPEWWRNRGFVAQMHRSVQYYICRRYGGYQWECVCVCVCGGGNKKV